MSIIESNEPYNYRNRYIHVSSAFKNANSSNNSNFNVEIPSEGGITDIVSSCYIKSISLPNIFPNVQPFQNTLILEDVAFSYEINVPVGQYTITTFISTLQALINTAIAPNTVAITLDPFNKLIFTFSAGTPYLFIYNLSTIAPIIGLTADVTDVITPNVIPMQSIPNLIGVTQVFVRSRTIGNSIQIDSQGAKPVIDILNINAPYGEMCFSNYKPDFNYIKYAPWQVSTSFRNIDITLTDYQENVLTWVGPNNDFNSNFNFDMIVKIFYQ